MLVALSHPIYYNLISRVLVGIVHHQALSASGVVQAVVSAEKNKPWPPVSDELPMRVQSSRQVDSIIASSKLTRRPCV